MTLSKVIQSACNDPRTLAAGFAHFNRNREQLAKRFHETYRLALGEQQKHFESASAAFAFQLRLT